MEEFETNHKSWQKIMKEPIQNSFSPSHTDHYV